MNTNNIVSSKTDTRPLGDTNAALRGATLAFTRPKPKAKPSDSLVSESRLKLDLINERNARNAKNGALAAATLAESAASHPNARSRNGGEGGGVDEGLVAQHSGTGNAPENPLRNRFLRGNVGAEHLTLPGAGLSRSLSPSYIAATLAASRSGSTTPSSPTRKSMLSPTARSVSRSRDVDGDEDRLDTSSIPATTSLIGLFEKSTAKGIPVRDSAQSTVVGVREPEATRLVHDFHSSSNAALSPKNDDDDVASSDDSFVSAHDCRPRPGGSLKRPPSSLSMDSRTIDAMATAIVASSLASSRAGSPSKTSQNLAPPPPPPRRNSPGKSLRTTMRKAPKASDEEDTELIKRGRVNIMKKHPNKHHEGDRKRWRDSITDRERKRYEAVWASNRGLYVQSAVMPALRTRSMTNTQDGSSLANCVSNLVVREIWSRSRLGPDILSEVWELVDRSRSGRLSRDEFVVGMWLVDQRLKGRKLPVRVGESVWGSVGGLEAFLVRGRRGR